MASPSLSAGDYQRLCRLKQLSSSIGRRRGLEKGAGGAESARKKESAQGGAVAVPPEPSEAEPAAEPQPAASADSVAAARPAPSALQRARAAAAALAASEHGKKLLLMQAIHPARSLSAPRAQPGLSAKSISTQLQRERHKAARRNDLHHLNRLKTPSGIAGFARQQRLRAYGLAQRQHNIRGRAGGSVGDGHVQSEIATQTDLSEWSKSMLARDEQSLEHLAEADLAYLEVVRTKAGLHHQTAGNEPRTS